MNQLDVGVFLTALLVSGIRFCAPLLFAATGEVVAERAGMLNVDLEAMMLIGALAGVYGSFLTGSAWVGVLAAMAAAALIALVKSVACVSLRVNQVVAGTGINIFALGLTTFAARYIFGFAQVPQVASLLDIRIPYLSEIPVVGPILFQHSPFVYLAFLLVPVWNLVLFRTKWGLNLRSVGEHPAAANSVGIGVEKVKYQALLICGMMCGLGGASISLGQLGLFMENMVAGRGFIALAAVVFGNWQPVRLMFVCLFFGLCQAGAYALQVLGLPLPPQVALSVPYVLTVLAFILAAGKGSAPAALAQPFVRE